MKIENIIISSLVKNEDFLRKTIPFMLEPYFEEKSYRIIFNIIDAHFKAYNSHIKDADLLIVELNKINDLNETIFNNTLTLIETIRGFDVSSYQPEWLLDNTESFCRDHAIFIALSESIDIIHGKADNVSKNMIPDKLQKALAVSFDSNVGHDYIKDHESRFEFYHKKYDKIPFDINMLNRITDGGIFKKSLSVFVAGTGIGKSLIMCHCAASNLIQGKNVLYITMEMSEERIAQRIDANLLDSTFEELDMMEKEVYERKINRIRDKTLGTLKIKEYPTGAAHVGHFRFLINELKSKQNFVPDIIYVDYLNICSSARIKGGSKDGLYSYVKSVTEELRGLAVEQEVALITATQVNRSGLGNSDFELDSISDSIGTSFTADLILAVISSEELNERNEYMFKQLKNRYGDPALFKKFLVGVNKSKMKLFDVEEPFNFMVDKKQKARQPDFKQKSDIDFFTDNSH